MEAAEEGAVDAAVYLEVTAVVAAVVVVEEEAAVVRLLPSAAEALNWLPLVVVVEQSLAAGAQRLAEERG